MESDLIPSALLNERLIPVNKAIQLFIKSFRLTGQFPKFGDFSPYRWVRVAELNTAGNNVDIVQRIIDPPIKHEAFKPYPLMSATMCQICYDFDERSMDPNIVHYLRLPKTAHKTGHIEVHLLTVSKEACPSWYLPFHRWLGGSGFYYYMYYRCYKVYER